MDLNPFQSIYYFYSIDVDIDHFILSINRSTSGQTEDIKSKNDFILKLPNLT